MRFNFKSFAATILAILGLSEWALNEQGVKIVTDEEREKLKSMGFSDQFLTGFTNALAKDFEEEAEPQTEPEGVQLATLRGLLSQTATQLAQAQQDLANLQAINTTDKAVIAQKSKEIATLQEKVKTLSEAAENDPGKGAQHQAGAQAQAFNLDDNQQLAGIAGEMYSMESAYNQRARAALLARRGIMLTAPAASSTDYSRLQNDLGAFYRIPWQERLQSLLFNLPTIESIFPLESGYQDLATLVNVWLGEFSQADNTASDFDNVVKGGYEFDNETLRMYSVMFAHKFTNLKELERTWIGSLNLEGSQPIKWSFIEYLLSETAKKLHNEREQRRVNGVRKDPDLNEPGKAMEAADGLYEFIRKKVDGFVDVNNGNTVYQIKPFVLGTLSVANIGEKIYQATSQIPAEIRDSGQLRLYMPSHMIVWYHKYNEAHYGTNQDYKADIMYVKEYPSVLIKAVPNADNHHRLIWTLEGNIKTFEHMAGEMTRFSIEQQDWTLKVWANWKESIWARAVGYKYTDPTAMDGTRQLIWCNEYDRPDNYFVTAEPDTNPDAKLHTSIVTVANTSKLSITDITNAAEGKIITLKCGSTDKGVQIAASGKFSLLASAWDPAVGDWIKLMKRSDGKFIEVARNTAATSDALAFTADDTTPSVDGATVFVTDVNTEATAITALDDAVVGVIYTIHGAGSTYASTIANSGNFVLTAAMTLSEGHFIKLVKAEDGKFYEVARG
jgi:hypothetical protein